MLRRRLVAMGTMGWVACVVAAVAWAGCGGSTEEAGTPQGTGGTADNDASTGGAGGTTQTGGSGGTTQTGGSGGIAGAGGTSVEPDGSPPDVATDGSQPDASCLVYNEACDPTGNDCCAPLACVQGSNGARCRLEPSDAGLDGAACMPPQQVCTQTPCCPGLECVSQGPTEICRMPFDGGFPEGGFPEGGTCHDLFEACGPGQGPCCQGLECKTDPPQYPDRQCLPPVFPDPADCPAQEPTPGDACTEVGMQCSYGMMTVCLCYLSGWQCAY